MEELKLGVIETRFAEIIWNNAPIASGELVKLCEKEFNWKKSTTYTVLKKLCNKGIFDNRDGRVEVIVSKEDFYSLKSEKIIEEEFSGSLPAFIAALTKRKNLDEKEIAEIKKMIDSFGRGKE